MDNESLRWHERIVLAIAEPLAYAGGWLYGFIRGVARTLRG